MTLDKWYRAPKTEVKAFTPQSTKPNKQYRLCYHCGTHSEVFPGYIWACPVCHNFNDEHNE